MNDIYCSTVTDKLFVIANLSKNLLPRLIFHPWLCVFSPRTSFKPRLTVRNPINSSVLSPTLLQIYCIGLIGPISYSFWVWAAICVPTVTIGVLIIIAIWYASSNIYFQFLNNIIYIFKYFFTYTYFQKNWKPLFKHTYQTSSKCVL